MKDIFKNKWFWIVVVAIILVIVAYKMGWFTKKKDVADNIQDYTPPREDKVIAVSEESVNDTTSNERASGDRLSSKTMIINRIITKIDNQPARVLNAVRAELNKLDVDKLNGIYSVVSVATNKPKGSSTLKANCSPMENSWNTALDNAGISCCHVCGGVWSF